MGEHSTNPEGWGWPGALSQGGGDLGRCVCDRACAAAVDARSASVCRLLVTGLVWWPTGGEWEGRNPGWAQVSVNRGGREQQRFHQGVMGERRRSSERLGESPQCCLRTAKDDEHY